MKRLLLVVLLLGLLGALFAAPAQARHAADRHGGSKDPCFMGESKFLDWYNGTRWGTSLNDVQANYAAGCPGSWDTTKPTYEDLTTGNLLQWREWPRSDGGNTWIMFEEYSTSPRWRAHDEGFTGHGSPLQSPLASDAIRRCEWPRSDFTGPNCSTVG